MTTQTINLNLIPQGVQPVIHVSQYDKGQTWIFKLMVGNAYYQIPAGASVTIQGTKKDGTGFQYACTYSGYEVTAIEQQQMTILAGDVPAELRITKGSELIGTLNFIIRVEKAALSDDTVISETELPLIEEITEFIAEVPAIEATMVGYKEDSEAWAKGTKNGQAVPSTADQYHNNSKWWAEQAAYWAAHPPIIGNNGNWFIYDTSTSQYVDTGEPSQGADGADGADGITPVISATASVDANVGTPAVTVTKSGSDAAPSFAFAFSNIKGNQGDTGATGNGIASITKTSTSGLVDTYTITYTNGTTSTFTVTNGQDGQGAGDMTKLVYDSDNAVSNAGGIAAYVHDDLITDAQWTAIQALYT